VVGVSSGPDAEKTISHKTDLRHEKENIGIKNI
jgi:hypothetical protein